MYKINVVVVVVGNVYTVVYIIALRVALVGSQRRVINEVTSQLSDLHRYCRENHN